MTDLKPYAMWTDDCQGKKDYDGRLISISTRYWPGPSGGGTMVFNTGSGEFSTAPYGKQPSAQSSILLNIGPREEHDGGGEYLIWREKEFSAPTEAEVKAQVEAWVQEQMTDIITLLGGMAAFRKWTP